jgi:hypothetical protein
MTPSGVFVPGEVLERRDLRPTEKLLLGFMENLSRKSGLAYASVEACADRLGIDPRTVRRALRDLEGRGFIVQEQPGRGRGAGPAGRNRPAPSCALLGAFGRARADFGELWRTRERRDAARRNPL